jgi:hypothetical protein
MNLLNLEDEKFKSIEVKGYKFKIKAMFPREKMLIAQRRIGFQNGNPVTCLSDDDFYFFESIAINDICIEEMPKSFKTNESSLNWPDNELIIAVANEIRKHTTYIEEELKKNKPSLGSEKE